MNPKRSHVDEAREHFLEGIGVPKPAPFIPDEFQKDAISSVVEGVDTLVVAPTGAGKTHIALEAMRAALLLKKKAIYTTPLKALSNTKYADLKRRFEPEFKVGLLTGDRKIDGDADVVVATTEIYRNELYRSSERYSLVVLDEVHFIADPQRGPVWEESIILTPSNATLLMLSASISNSIEIASWLEDVRGKPCRVVTKKERPVELRFGFLHPDLGVMPLVDSRGGIYREVLNYYGGSGLDSSGMRLRGGSFSRRPQGERQGERQGGRFPNGGRGRGRGRR